MSGAGETLRRAVAVGLMLSITGVLDGAIVESGTGDIPQLLINPAMKISTGEILMSSSLVVEPQQAFIRIIP